MQAPVLDEPSIALANCQWWNLVCQGGQKVTDSGLSAITTSMSSGLVQLFGGITKVVDDSTTVPLADPTYRDVYFGFVGLALPVVAAVFFIALLAAVVRRDPGTLSRAAVGVMISTIGGAVYVIFAQLLVGFDDWLSHGVVAITGADFESQMNDMATSFRQMGDAGEVAANMLMLLLMMVALVAGLALWVVLLLRKMAILVVVVFAPLLIAGWMWAPTRSWSRKATETLIALVFCKTVIYVLFGVGMRLLFRGTDQGLSDFVGVVVLLCGACFAPLVMLRLVHFAADTPLAGEMVGALKQGTNPVTSRLPMKMPGGGGRNDMAREYARGPQPRGGGAVVGGPIGYGDGAGGTSGNPGAKAGAMAGGGKGAPTSGGGAAAGASGKSLGTSAGAAGGPAGVAAAAAAVTVAKAKQAANGATQTAKHVGQTMTERPASVPSQGSDGPTSSGPELPSE